MTNQSITHDTLVCYFDLFLGFFFVRVGVRVVLAGKSHNIRVLTYILFYLLVKELPDGLILIYILMPSHIVAEGLINHISGEPVVQFHLKDLPVIIIIAFVIPEELYLPSHIPKGLIDPGGIHLGVCVRAS